MYIHYNDNPRGNYEAGDCVIRAISIATDKSWDEIYVALCAEGFYAGDWGNNNGVWDWYVRSLGFTRHIIPNDCPHCYTVADFVKEHPSGTYILATGTHAIAAIDGSFIDAFDSGNLYPIYYYEKR